MDLEQDYIQYVAEFSLALLAVSAAYFFDPGKIYSYGTLLLIPLLYGYTSHISREGFKTSSILSFIALIFAPLNPQIAVFAVLIAFGNVFVSLLSGGNSSFTDHYNTVALPMLFTGVVLGTMFYVGISVQPGLAEDVRIQTSTFTSEQASTLIEETQIMDTQRESQTQIIAETSRITVRATQGHVLNETQEEFGPNQQQILLNAFQNAEEEIPGMLQEGTEEQTDSIDISEELQKSIENLLEGDRVGLLAPMIVIMIYGLHPVIGLLTAISAVSFRRLEQF